MSFHLDRYVGRFKLDGGQYNIKYYCTNLTSNEILSLAIVGILTADAHTENML